MRRRHFLTFSATAVGGVLVFTLDRHPMRVHAQSDKKIRVPLRFFDQREALLVSAATAFFPATRPVPAPRRQGWSSTSTAS
jgi:hypothetical protein